jgi:ketohexokinase
LPGIAEAPRRILGVGVATLDIINEVAAWPAEDDEVRALAQRISRGGNAANSLVVLSQLGHACAFAGTLASDAQSGLILADLHRAGIATIACVRHPGGSTPTSYVALSRATGSRTIIHYRDLPELRAAELADIDLDPFDWVHFEGRNPAETATMIAACRRQRPGLPISLEIEKPRPGVEALMDGPDVLMFSRAYARANGFRDPEPFLAEQRTRTSASRLILSWGEGGSYGLDGEGGLRHAPSQPPAALVDTLGAGDVLNAAVIDGLLAELPLAEILGRANRLAGYKCGRAGLAGLVAEARGTGWG